MHGKKNNLAGPDSYSHLVPMKKNKGGRPRLAVPTLEEEVAAAAHRERAAFGRNVTHVRDRLGKSQKEIASRVGISNKTLCGFERGLNWPSMPVYVSLCRALMLPMPPLFSD